MTPGGDQGEAVDDEVLRVRLPAGGHDQGARRGHERGLSSRWVVVVVASGGVGGGGGIIAIVVGRYGVGCSGGIVVVADVVAAAFVFDFCCRC